MFLSLPVFGCHSVLGCEGGEPATLPEAVGPGHALTIVHCVRSGAQGEQILGGSPNPPDLGEEVTGGSTERAVAVQARLSDDYGGEYRLDSNLLLCLRQPGECNSKKK